MRLGGVQHKVRYASKLTSLEPLLLTRWTPGSHAVDASPLQQLRKALSLGQPRARWGAGRWCIIVVVVPAPAFPSLLLLCHSQPEQRQQRHAAAPSLATAAAVGAASLPQRDGARVNTRSRVCVCVQLPLPPLSTQPCPACSRREQHWRGDHAAARVNSCVHRFSRTHCAPLPSCSRRAL